MGAKKYVYFFGKGKADGRGNMKDLLGGKGAGLAEMTNLGIRVPPGFTISTEACVEYYRNNESYPAGMWDQVLEHLKRVEETMGLKFGDTENPLLVSVRSGARVSMPGMMDTVLNVGLNDKSVLGLARKSNNDRFAFDAYRRFITMFGSVVMGVDRSLFEEILQEKKDELRVNQDTDLGADVLKEMVTGYKKLVKKETGKDFPMDPVEQMMMAINAVFNSWNAARAITYRKIHNLPHDMGTAANVVAMVFGNMGETSGTGVAFTRDPSSGERKFFGECLMNAQGEDVVAGIRPPFPIEDLQKIVPDAYKELVDIYQKLEKHYKDMLDIEFTIQEGTLYMLQTRTGKRTAASAIRIAVDMVEEGLIDKDTAILRINPDQLDQLLHPMIDPDAKVKIAGRGLPASPGAAVGRAVFNAEDAERMAREGERCVLVRMETSPEDIGGMHAAQGILTSRGGMTSHAAVVARGMGKPCVVGCSDIQVKEKEKYFKVNDQIIKEGDYITLNGSTGDVIPGEVSLIKPKLSESFATMMKWVDKIRTLKVRTNADTPFDAQVARDFGAEGIGLCRTEHMFFEPNRIKAVREMILSDDIEGRKRALAKLLPFQKGDFTGIFRAMKGLPVTIRLLDPPLHEFLPHTDAEIDELSKDMGVPADRLMAKNKTLYEFNPMLGHRGCRLGITYPEIYEMQARAIFEAACELECEGVKVVPEVMIPLVGFSKELTTLKEMVDRVAGEVMKAYKVTIKYQVGTMIELPRAALIADEIAKTAEFFSFGTNDLTQTTLGLSRDDAGKFLPFYIEKGIFDTDPFVSIDQEGVGQLVKIGIEKGRSTRANLKVGICGEHGGDPKSIDFCYRAGMDYVSCSPYRVPIARFAAAQAVLRGKK
ncbi:MAG: pyruvate, phosphate dikinase [Nitrospira sp.]|nr:pyruvate, phosphate dikinase [Nitrospira sp.]